nr:hypothetical protein [Tanacetum cinerariifolium]
NVKVISSDDERTESDKEKVNEEIANEEMADEEKANDEKTKDEKSDDEQAKADQANNDQAGVIIIETQNERPELPPSLFWQILSELETNVEALSKVDHTKVIEESVKANSSSTQVDSLTEHELKNKLFDMIKKSRYFLEHEKNIELYNALIGLIGLDEAISKGKLDPTRVLKKRSHDDKDQDPPIDSEKEKKRRRRKDTESSNKQTTSTESSKGKNLSTPLFTNKIMNADESIQGAEMDVEEPVEDDVVNVEEQPQDDAAPKRDNSIWFKQDTVVRPETLDPKWHKEPAIDDAPK